MPRVAHLVRTVAAVAPLLVAGPGLPAAEPQRPAAAAAMDAVVADLEAFARAGMASQKVPGLAFALVQGEALVHAEGYGVKKAGGTDPVTAGTVFEVGSTTKAFTSTLVGMLVDEGKLRWSTRVAEVLPRFAMHDPWVTREFRVDDLMTARSGMPGHALDQMSYLGFTRQQIASAVVHVEPTFSFRSGYGYVNTLWTWAAGLAERLWGLSWEEAMARRVLGPLGMTASTVDPEVVPLLDDVATSHMTLSDGTPWPIPPDWRYRVWVDAFGPAGGLRSNVVDMSRWARLHLGNGVLEGQRLLSAGTATYLHTGRTTVTVAGARTTSYALGWVHDSRAAGPVVWHNGETSGAHAIVALYPSADVGLVVLTNTNGNGLPEAMADRLYALLHPSAPAGASVATVAACERGPASGHALGGTLGPAPPLPLSRYAGTFVNPAYGPVAVLEKGGGLVAVIGPLGFEMPLAHSSGNVFVMTYPGYPESGSIVTFSVPPGAGAARVRFEAYEDVSGGWFERSGR